MTLVTGLYEIGLLIKNKLSANQNALGIQQVFYGDQDRVNTTPIACVETDTKTGDLTGAQRQVTYEVKVFVLLYVAKVGSSQENRAEVDALATQVETVLNADANLGGAIIHGYVTSIEAGYATKTDSVVRAIRITYTATTQARLP